MGPFAETRGSAFKPLADLHSSCSYERGAPLLWVSGSGSVLALLLLSSRGCELSGQLMITAFDMKECRVMGGCRGEENKKEAIWTTLELKGCGSRLL